MKLVLPSMGFFGTKVVDMRQPTIADLRAVQSMDSNPDICKVQFVQQLIPDLDLRKISKCDVDYLFAVAAFSVVMNTVTYDIECPHCGEKHSFTYNFGGQDLIELDLPSKITTRKVGDDTLSFKVLTAKEHMDGLEYALTQEDFYTAYTDYSVARTLGIDVDNIKTLPLQHYITALIFQQATFHGLHFEDIQVCSKCGKMIDTHIELPISMVSLSVSALMQKFNSLSDRLNYESFLKLSLPEYKALVEDLNERMRNG